jgi:ribbon-helix-helix protein
VDAYSRMTVMRKIASLLDVKKVNLYFVSSHWKELQAISRKTGVPVSVMVRKIVAEWLKARKTEKKQGEP